MQKYLTTPTFYGTTGLGGVAGFQHASNLWEKFYLEQYQVSKAFHQLHKFKSPCQNLKFTDSHPTQSSECECEEIKTQLPLPHHSENPSCPF